MRIRAVQHICAVVALALFAGCHSPGAPSTTSTQSGTPTTFTLNGKVVVAGIDSSGISHATVTVADGPVAGKSVTTSGSGNYTLTGLQQASFTITVSAAGFITNSMSVTANQFATTVLDYTTLTVLISDALDVGGSGRPVPGAAVQLLDGPQAGASAITDANGAARFDGTFGASVALSIRKDGYFPIQMTVQINCCGPVPPHTAWIVLELKAPDLVQLTPGQYSVTIATDGTCPTIPADLQTRTYSASVAPYTYAGSQGGNGLYVLTLDLPGRPTFQLDVSGRDVSITIGGDFGPFVDSSSGLSINAGGVGTVATSPASVVSMPLSYQFLYRGAVCNGSNGLFTLQSVM